jgi:hypothetical protein
MNNLAALQQTYIQSNPFQQLEFIANRLNRIATICNESKDLSSAIELIRESQYFIEWTAPNISIDDAVELVELGRILADWKFRWLEISSDPVSILNVRNLAQSWHKRLCNGLQNA